MASEPLQYKISNGPGRFDLMVGLFDDDEWRKVRFSFQVPHESPPGHKQMPEGITYWVEVVVWTVERSYRPGDAWIVKGRVAMSNYAPLCAGRGMGLGDLHRFRASFSSQTRKGTITFTELPPAEQCA